MNEPTEEPQTCKGCGPFVMNREKGKKKQAGVSRAPLSRIVLTGFRATGKTAVGRHLAALTGFRFLDTDQEITARMGCSIAEAVRQHGWPYFREHERALLRELPLQRKTVIATGGGAVLHRREWQELHDCSFVVWLRTDPAATLSRLCRDTKTASQRPSLADHESGQDSAMEIAALLAEREPLYRTGSDRVMETERRTPEELAEKIYLLARGIGGKK